ncbi:AraC family transcriptional regulator [Consotaella salsifontis]|uniref:Transcriptional regulator, AraC family n=1 Tax=Consotaella salsifontis TaxID=1365950 RepID=A0A1T4R9Y5_9HYPH|nr:AraC family transcriptional regulator [Consotaella salsifontis]SKA12441.1 transcriptional regulator, AraC family [Consotaella salsifontis]
MTSRDRIWFARDEASGIEAVRARFFGHAYDLHHHDEWLVGVTDHGVQNFHCRGRRQRSTPERIILIEPGEMHDGDAGPDGGFTYSMLYLPQELVRREVRRGEAREGGFRATLSDDPSLASAIRNACMTLAEPAERLTRDAAFDAVLSRLRMHLGFVDKPEVDDLSPLVARRARDRLRELYDEPVGADELAQAVGARDRFQLARAFRAAYGTSPHRYMMQVRLSKARDLLKRGEAPAVVASTCGFADQSHFGRWFRRAYGVTPAAYRARTDVPDALFRRG